MSEQLEDYATSRVPEHRTIGGVRIGMINGGLAFAVPGLVTGLEIGNALGFEASLTAFLLGGFILSILGSITGTLGMYNRLTSCMTLKFVFGQYGANILSFIFAISLLGWYGVTMDLFSAVSQELAQQLFNSKPEIWAIEAGAGLLITLTALVGFQALEKISSLFVPILFLVVLYLLFQSVEFQEINPASTIKITSDLSFGEAVSAVIGSFIISVALMPDFSRFAATKTDAVIGSFLPFLAICSFVYIASAYAGSVVDDKDILVVMQTLGLGVFSFVLLILSSWITNAVNLYSAALGINAILQKSTEWKIVAVAGFFGTVVASFNLLEQFTDFLFSLSIIFTPVAAVCIADFFFLRKKHLYDLQEIKSLPLVNWQAVVAWSIGIGISILSNNGIIFITSVEACDAVLVTIPAYLVLKKM